jgi:hypothetical protein
LEKRGRETMRRAVGWELYQLAQRIRGLDNWQKYYPWLKEEVDLSIVSTKPLDKWAEELFAKADELCPDEPPKRKAKRAHSKTGKAKTHRR